MATYQFSTLSDGQAISFNPNVDVINFDQSSIGAADMRFTAEGANLRVEVFRGNFAGKDILLQNVSLPQLALSNVTFADGSRLLVGDNTSGTANDNAANSLTGTAGRDQLIGLGGADTLNGGAGDDVYFASTGDVLVDSGGRDQVYSDVSWTLASGFEDLTLTGTANASANGNNSDNVIFGNTGNNYFNGRAGSDFIWGREGNDTIDMSTGGTGLQGNDTIDGGDGIDTVDYDGYAQSGLNGGIGGVFGGSVTGGGVGGEGFASLFSIERLIGGAFNDTIGGGDGGQYLDGRGGNDAIDGGGGNDTLLGGVGNDSIEGNLGNDVLTGGAGLDSFIFDNAPASAQADSISDFASGADKLLLSNQGFQNIGAFGNFATGDARFWASASGAAHDADDRVLYNTTTRQVFYDADGNGTGAAQLIAALQPGATLTATDIAVAGDPGGGSGAHIVGTAGDDSLDGGDGDDTLEGLGGDDTLNGWGGADRLEGGAGDDSLVGGSPFDPDSGDYMIGGEGNDTLDGDAARFGDQDPSIDTMDGGLGNDHYIVDNPNDVLIDAGGVDTVEAMNMGWTLASGFENLYLHNDEAETLATGIGNELDNFMRGGWGVQLEGRAGNDTLMGTARPDILLGGDGNDLLDGGEHNDQLDGGAGNDTLYGSWGDDSVSGGTGDDWLYGDTNADGFIGSGVDSLTGGTGADNFVLSQAPDGLMGPDRITDFASALDQLHLDAREMPELGASGRLAAGDARFYAAAGATSGHDADDRLIYNTSTNELFFDADGSGSQEAIRIVTLQAGASLAATDIIIDNGGQQPGETINGTGGSDRIDGTSGNDTINGLGGNDTLNGGDGNDRVDGGDGDDLLISSSGNDTLLGGAGNDSFTMDHDGAESFGQDVIDGSTGIDFIAFSDAQGPVVIDAAAGTLSGPHAGDSARIFGIEIYNLSSEYADRFIGGVLAETVYGMGGEDTLEGGGGDDTLWGGGGGGSSANLLISGGDGNDELRSESAGTLQGGAGDDRLFGGSLQEGGAGNDRLTGRGNSTLTGGTGADSFVFDSAGTLDAKQITDFLSGADELRIDATRAEFAAMPAGDFVAGDARFYAAAGATGGHDADDRIVYNTTTRQVFYDADGNGAGAALLLATLQPGATLAATDIGVDGGTGSGSQINGTPGNDSLVGSTGNDTINGLGGNDTIRGMGGSDSLSGGDGNDLVQAASEAGDSAGDFLSGGAGNDTLDATARWDAATADTLDGGLGDDEYHVDLPGDTLIDAGGTDKVVAHDTDWTLADGFENLLLNNDVSESGFTGIGNALANELSVSWGGSRLEGRGGNDTLRGSLHSDRLLGGDGNDILDGGDRSDALDGGAGNDTLTGGSPDGFSNFDEFIFTATPGAANADLITDFVSAEDRIHLDGGAMPALGFSGNFMAGDARFYAAAGATGGHDADDRVVYDTSTGRLFYDADGSGSGAGQLIATLQGAPTLVDTDVWVDNGVPGATRTGTAGNDSLVGTGGDDSMSGLAGNDTLQGLDGQDTLDGGDGQDRIEGGRGNDQIFHGSGADTVSGGAGIDTVISGFGDSSTDLFVFDVAPGIANHDSVVGFVANLDVIVLDRTVYTAIGPDGAFSAGDVRFYSAANATSGHDADDRIIYNPGDGTLWYDADGSGAGASLLIADLSASDGFTPPDLAATDIRVGMPGAGQSITGTAGNDTLMGGDGNDTIEGLAGNDSLSGADGQDIVRGGDGNDTLWGVSQNGDMHFDEGEPLDTLDGGLGNDEYHVRGDFFLGAADTILADPGGIDTVYAHDTYWTLGAGLDNLTFIDSRGSFFRGIGNDLDNIINGGGAEGVDFQGLGGDDLMISGAFGSSGMDGGDGNDTLIGNSHGDGFNGGAGNDVLDGANGADDVLTGGTGADAFVRRGGEGLASEITDFLSGTDKIRLDGQDLGGFGFKNMGANGNFAAGDARFWSSASGTAHDADDRVIYNSSTGDLWYDDDGNGAGAARHIFVLQGTPALVATDIEVVNGEGAGRTINGTAGADSLTGSAGGDTLNGLAGNDTLHGLAGDDRLDGGTGIDSMDGGAGNDTYVVTAGDVLVDSSGNDSVSSDGNWTLANGFENLTLVGTGNWQANGNNGNNILIGNSGNNYFNARAGSDAIYGGGGNDTIDMSTGGTSQQGNDTIDGEGGIDTVDYDGYAVSAVNANLATTFVTGGGAGGSGSAIVNGIERFIGGGFNDSIRGSAAAEYLDGRGGNDTLGGGAGHDTLIGGAGNDAFVFDALGSANSDLVSGFASGVDRLHMEDAVMTAIGATGNFAAGDVRYWEAAGATSGHDANDRIVYNTSSGNLYYDADGSGAGAAQLIATLQGNAALDATDIFVI